MQEEDHSLKVVKGKGKADKGKSKGFAMPVMDSLLTKGIKPYGSFAQAHKDKVDKSNAERRAKSEDPSKFVATPALRADIEKAWLNQATQKGAIQKQAEKALEEVRARAASRTKSKDKDKTADTPEDNAAAPGKSGKGKSDKGKGKGKPGGKDKKGTTRSSTPKGKSKGRKKGGKSRSRGRGDRKGIAAAAEEDEWGGAQDPFSDGQGYEDEYGELDKSWTDWMSPNPETPKKLSAKELYESMSRHRSAVVDTP